MTGRTDWTKLFHLDPSFFHDYEIIEIVGKGGMGQVVKARQLSLDRLVAIKFLARKFFEDEKTMERFKSEAKLLAKLSHPNVVQIVTLNTRATNPYLVLEFVDGESLRSRLKRSGMLSQVEALKIVREICLGLKAAHELNIVHRDVKSDNVLISNKGTVKLVDFGIAKDTEGRGNQTTTGVVMGTPHYMSPEQCHGENLDCRTDIYSTGVLLFRLLTGQVPFFDESTIKVLFHHVNTPPPDLREYAPNIKTEVNELVQKALQKERDARFQSADEFIAAIDDVLHNLADELQSEEGTLRQSALPQKMGENTKLIGKSAEPVTWWEKNPIIAAILLLAVLVMTVTWVTFPEVIYEPPKLKVEEKRDAKILRIEAARKRLVGWRDVEVFEGKTMIGEISALLNDGDKEIQKAAEEALADVIRCHSPGGLPMSVASEAAMQLTLKGNEVACESLWLWLPAMSPERRLDVLLVLRRTTSYVKHRFSQEAKKAIGGQLVHYKKNPPIKGCSEKQQEQIIAAIKEYEAMVQEEVKGK